MFATLALNDKGKILLEKRRNHIVHSATAENLSNFHILNRCNKLVQK